MCGIAGIIHRETDSDIGTEMSQMLQSMKHRGPDSTGYALFGPATEGEVVIRFKLADANDPRGFDFSERLERSRVEVESRLHKIGASVDRVEGVRMVPMSMSAWLRRDMFHPVLPRSSMAAAIPKPRSTGG